MTEAPVSERMPALLAEFERDIGMPAPIELLPEVRWHGVKRYRALFATDDAPEEPRLDQSLVRDRDYIKDQRGDYAVFGYWGHGTNSYAYYFQRVDSWRRIFLRLAYGGLYMDPVARAKEIRHSLERCLSFQRACKGRVREMIAVDSMGDQSYSVTRLDGATWKSEDHPTDDELAWISAGVLQ